MRFHCLQHVPFEGPARIGQWAEENRHMLTFTHLYRNEALPAHDSFDGLLILGGPMNIYEHEQFPWLVREKAFIRTAIDRGAAVLGVCLGAQLVADVLGGKVTRNPQKEIGWYPVQLTEDAKRTKVFAQIPDEFTPIHWHGDTFEIPPGAVLTASSPACVHQAFVYQEKVVALQFHLEYTQESIEGMLEHCAEELVDGPWIQPERAIAAQHSRCVPANDILVTLLNALQDL